MTDKLTVSLTQSIENKINDIVSVTIDKQLQSVCDEFKKKGDELRKEAQKEQLAEMKGKFS